MSTIANVVDAFQAINAGVRGIKFSPNSSSIPAQLSPDKLPAAITWYADDDWAKVTETHFMIEVYVSPVGSANPTLAMANCLALVEAFRETYRGLHKVDGFAILREPGGGRRGFGSDGVHKTMGYAGQEFFGFSFGVPIFGIQ
jgi:hypothetical protein